MPVFNTALDGEWKDVRGNLMRDLEQIHAETDRRLSTALNADGSLNTTTRALFKAAGVVLTTTNTGNLDNFSLAAAAGADLVLRCDNGSSSLTFTGFDSGRAGQTITVVGLGTGTIAFSHQNGSSAGPNRLSNLVSSADSKMVAPRGFATYQYDATSLFWRMLSFDQGDWITPSYVSTDFDGGNQTWTVQSGDVTSIKYYQSGRNLDFECKLTDTSISGSTDSVIYILNGQWGGFTTNGFSQGTFQWVNPVVPVNGIGVIQSTWDTGVFAATKLRLNKVTDVWTNSTNQTVIFATGRFPLL